MSTLDVLDDQDFRSICSQVDEKVIALGNVYREKTTKEKVSGSLLSSLLGVFAKTVLEKERWRYVALTSDALFILDFADGDRTEKIRCPLAEIQVRDLRWDESLLQTTFAYAGQEFTLKIQRYQLPSLEGDLLTDPEQMKQVGEMTQRIERALATRRTL
jgi:hypothetical protein